MREACTNPSQCRLGWDGFIIYLLSKFICSNLFLFAKMPQFVDDFASRQDEIIAAAAAAGLATRSHYTRFGRPSCRVALPIQSADAEWDPIESGLSGGPQCSIVSSIAMRDMIIDSFSRR